MFACLLVYLHSNQAVSCFDTKHSILSIIQRGTALGQQHVGIYFAITLIRNWNARVFVHLLFGSTVVSISPEFSCPTLSPLSTAGLGDVRSAPRVALR